MFITDDKGKKVSVILSIREYQRMLGELEELDDIRLYDKVKALNEANEPLADYLTSRRLNLKNSDV